MFYFYQNSAIWLYCFKVLLAVALFSLSGCITTPSECKPSEVDNVITSLRCSGSGGGMEKNVEALELSLEELNSEVELTEDKTHALQQQSRELSQDINLYQNYLSRNLEKIQEDEAVLDEIRPINLVMQEKKLSLEKELASMKAKLKQEKTKNAVSRKEVYELSKTVKQYREAIDDFYKTIVE